MEEKKLSSRVYQHATSVKQVVTLFVLKWQSETKAISKVKKAFPDSPKRFSLVVFSLIASATPRRKAELKKNIVCSPGAKRKRDMIDTNSWHVSVSTV